MKTLITIPTSFIKTIKKTNPDITDKQIEEVFQAFIQDWLIQEEMCTGMSNNFEIWVEESDDYKYILEGLGV